MRKTIEVCDVCEKREVKGKCRLCNIILCEKCAMSWTQNKVLGIWDNQEILFCKKCNKIFKNTKNKLEWN